MYPAFQRGTAANEKHKWKEVCGRMRDFSFFFDLTNKVNKRGSGDQAQHSGLFLLTALIGVLVSFCEQIQQDHNPLTSQAGTVLALPTEGWDNNLALTLPRTDWNTASLPEGRQLLLKTIWWTTWGIYPTWKALSVGMPDGDKDYSPAFVWQNVNEAQIPSCSHDGVLKA